MSDAINYCDDCPANVPCHMERRCLRSNCDNKAGAIDSAATCSLSDSQLLRELLNCFYWNGKGLEWSYVEGTHIGEVLTPEIDARLQEIKENRVLSQPKPE